MRSIERLTSADVAESKPPGRYSDGSGLYLRIARGADGNAAGKSWVMRYRIGGRQREFGLGRPDTFSLKEARARAKRCRQLVAEGVDPIEHFHKLRRAPKPADPSITFAAIAAKYIEAHRAGWSNAKHAAQWTATLTTYCEPIATLPVGRIDTALVLACIEPAWATKTETMTRVRQRIEAVLDYAKVSGLRTGENPARWKGHLDKLLPKATKVRKVKHHAALPYLEAPAFMAELRKHDGFSARCLELQVLTATRPGEACGAQWSEIDLDAATWTIPPERMKASIEHRVPLAPAVVAMLRELARTTGPYLFPGWRSPRKSITTAAALELLKAMRPGIVPHGFRSTFRDWAGETTRHPREVVEHALAHQLKDKAEAAYQRGDLFQRRRALMADWAAYCASGQ